MTTNTPDSVSEHYRYQLSAKHDDGREGLLAIFETATSAAAWFELATGVQRDTIGQTLALGDITAELRDGCSFECAGHAAHVTWELRPITR